MSGTRFDVVFYTMGAVLVIALTMTVLRVCTGCAPPAPPSIPHQLDLSACRSSSEAYRDAGPDAEWAAYKACADKADQKDRSR